MGKSKSYPMIENIYMDYITGDEYPLVDKGKLAAELCADMDISLSRIKDSELFPLLEDAVYSAQAAGEARGFALGFRYAMRLAFECGMTNGGEGT